MKNKIKAPKSTWELIHNWANQVYTRSYVKGNYKADGKYLLKRNYMHQYKPIAIIEKDYIWIDCTLYGGGFGRGITTYDIRNAIPNTEINKIIESNIPLTIDILNDKLLFQNWIKEYVTINREYWFQSIGRFKEWIYNFRLKDNNHSLLRSLDINKQNGTLDLEYNSSLKSTIDYLNSVLKNKKRWIYSTKIKGKFYGNIYKGWSKPKKTEAYFECNHTIRELINYKNIFSKQEIEDANYRYWWDLFIKPYNKYVSTNLSQNKAKAIYSNQIKKNEFEQEVAAIKNRERELRLIREQRAERKRIEAQSEKIYKYLSAIEKWKNGEIMTKNLPFKPYDIKCNYLKLVRGIIHTDSHVQIPLEEGLKAYAAMISSDIQWYQGKLIDNFSIIGKTLVNVIYIKNNNASFELETQEEEALIIGCHKITLREMEDLINRHNIDITNIKKE